MDRIYIIGLGQPMIDVVKDVSEDILEANHLEKNNAIRANTSHCELFSEVREDESTNFIPGGSTTNTLKVASKLLNKSNKKVGCIGKKY